MNALKKIRQERGYTANKLAIMTGVTRQHLSNIEHGKSEMSVELAKKLGKILGVNWAEFFDD